MFKVRVIKNLNLGYRPQIMNLGSLFWVFNPRFLALGAGPFNSYYKT